MADDSRPVPPFARQCRFGGDAERSANVRERQTMNDSKRQRPPLDYLGCYNIPGSESWMETPDIKRLKVSEFYKVRTDVVAALSKHGRVYGECEGEEDFFVYDDKFCDRTQKIELTETERLPEIIVPAVAELQRVLKQHNLWRVMFIGSGSENQAKEQFFVVYPDIVRIRQLQPGKSIDEALVENAQIRLRHRREPEEQSCPSSIETTTPANTVEPEVPRSKKDNDVNIGDLKHWSRVALAAEVAEIVRPLFDAAWPEAGDEYREAVVRAIKLAGRSAVAKRPCPGLEDAADDAIQAAGRAQIPHLYPVEDFDDGQTPKGGG
jgi:hypothetical protein